MSLLSNDYTSLDELAAAFGLPEMIADQTEIEKETCLHLADLSLGNSPCKQEEED